MVEVIGKSHKEGVLLFEDGGMAGGGNQDCSSSPSCTDVTGILLCLHRDCCKLTKIDFFPKKCSYLFALPKIETYQWSVLEKVHSGGAFAILSY